jgi:hypothetical protein
MTHTTHSSARVLACVKRYRVAKVAEYQRKLESDAEAVLVRLRRHYKRWKWFINIEPQMHHAMKEASANMLFWDKAALDRANDIADSWVRLLRGTEFVEVSLEDSWILDY